MPPFRRAVTIAALLLMQFGSMSQARADSGWAWTGKTFVRYDFTFHNPLGLLGHPLAALYATAKADAIHKARIDHANYVMGVEALLAEARQMIADAKALIGSVNWYAISECESGGRWQLVSGNGFFGGLQFVRKTWIANGGEGFDAADYPAGSVWPFTIEDQIRVANNLYAKRGLAPWPVCGASG